MDSATLDRQIERQLESLRREFADFIPENQVAAIGRAHADWLRAEARILDFIPVLAYRFAREELVEIRQDELQQVA